MPKVSVIIPNYNHGQFLAQRLDSVLGQTFQDFEIIFLDDTSTDDSKTVFARYADERRVKAVFNEKNTGNPFKQWNKGAQLATGEYLWIAESDDYAAPSFLAELVRVLDENPNVGVVYCHSPFVDESNKVQDWSLGEKWSGDFISKGKEQFVFDLLTRNAIPNASAALIRKSVFDDLGGADESMSFCGDWATWVKIALISDVAYVAKPLNYYRRHSATVSSRVNRTLTFVEEHYRIIRYIKERIEIPEDRLDAACEGLTHLWLDISFNSPRSDRFRQSQIIFENSKLVDARPRFHLLKCVLIRLLSHLHLVSPLYSLRNRWNGTNVSTLKDRTVS